MGSRVRVQNRGLVPILKVPLGAAQNFFHDNRRFVIAELENGISYMHRKLVDPIEVFGSTKSLWYVPYFNLKKGIVQRPRRGRHGLVLVIEGYRPFLMPPAAASATIAA